MVHPLWHYLFPTVPFGFPAKIRGSEEDGSCECMPTVWMALVQYSLDSIAYDVENVCITYEQQEVITKYVFDRACHVPGGQVIDHLCTYHYYLLIVFNCIVVVFIWPGCFFYVPWCSFSTYHHEWYAGRCDPMPLTFNFGPENAPEVLAKRAKTPVTLLAGFLGAGMLGFKGI